MQTTLILINRIIILNLLFFTFLSCKKLPEGFRIIDGVPIYIGNYEAEIVKMPVVPEPVTNDKRFLVSNDGGFYRYYIDTDCNNEWYDNYSNNINDCDAYTINSISIEASYGSKGETKTRKFADIIADLEILKPSYIDDLNDRTTASWALSNKGIVIHQQINGTHTTVCLFINNNLQLEKYAFLGNTSPALYYVDYGICIYAMSSWNSISYVMNVLRRNSYENYEYWDDEWNSPCESVRDMRSLISKDEIVLIDYLDIFNTYAEDSSYYYSNRTKSLSIPKFNALSKSLPVIYESPTLVWNDNFVFFNYYSKEENKIITGNKILVYNLPKKILRIFSWHESFKVKTISNVYIKYGHLYFTNGDAIFPYEEDRHYFRIPLDVFFNNYISAYDLK